MSIVKTVFSVIIFILVIVAVILHPAVINTSLAKSIVIKHYYLDNNVDLIITDKNDIADLKKIFRGLAFVDSPACGFSLSTSITFIYNSKELIFCPACDGDPITRVGETEYYMWISNKKRQIIDSILAKYGMIFPCI